MTNDVDPGRPGDDAEADADAIPAEEERLLARVLASVAARAAAVRRAAHAASAAGEPTDARRGYADEMVALRDEIGEARLEDVPALVAQMERLQGVSATRGDLQTLLVDPASPYFGHLRLSERIPGRGEVQRDVLIGRATFVDAAARVNIVDWRHAPVSQLFYRYAEGSDYEERFGDRDVEGDIVARRTLTIENGVLLRVACPQGVWARATSQGSMAPWRRTDLPTHALAGGQDTAARPARGVLGAAPAGRQALDRHLPEIAALIDPRQFDVMTAPGAGVVVIQGGAGSGKTTVGLHRLAYLAYNQPTEFPARRLGVITHGVALAAYIGQVLPSLGVGSVRAGTFGDLAARALRAEIPVVARRRRRRGAAGGHAREEPPGAAARAGTSREGVPGQARIARGRRAVGGPADRSRAPARAAARRRGDAGARARRPGGARGMTDRVAAVLARDPRESGRGAAAKGAPRAREGGSAGRGGAHAGAVAGNALDRDGAGTEGGPAHRGQRSARGRAPGGRRRRG